MHIVIEIGCSSILIYSCNGEVGRSKDERYNNTGIYEYVDYIHHYPIDSDMGLP